MKVVMKPILILYFHQEKNILYEILFHITVTSAMSKCQDIQLYYMNKIYKCIKYKYLNFFDITLVCEDINVY